MSCIPCPYTAVYHVTLDTQFAPTFCMLKEAYFGYKRRSSISDIASPGGKGIHAIVQSAFYRV